MDSMAESLVGFQQCQKPWIVHNFPGHKPWHPLLGIVEGFGELAAAGTESDRENAAADVVAYIADYCSEKGWNLASLWGELRAVDPPERDRTEASILVNLGKLCHAHLNQVRGVSSGEDWDAEGKSALSKLLSCLRCFSSEVNIVVSKRDWRDSPTAG